MDQNIMNHTKQHAILAALLSKHAQIAQGEKGKEAVLEIFRTIGRQRGQRMAKRALANQDQLDYVSYSAYGELDSEPVKTPGHSADLYQGSDGAVKRVYTCGWLEAWKEHDLLDYGRLYCQVIDESLYSAFNPDYHCTIKQRLSNGNECCEFHWHQDLKEGDEQRISEKKARFGKTYVKSFDYQVGNLLSVALKILKERLGEEGVKIYNGAIRDFIDLFGGELIIRAENAYINEVDS